MDDSEIHIIEKAIDKAFFLGRSHAFTRELEELKTQALSFIKHGDNSELLECGVCGKYAPYKEMIVTADIDICSTCHFERIEEVDENG